METVGHSCPDPEALAAWLDRGLSATESAEIEAHVAGCDDCRVVVAHVLETQSAVHDPVVVSASALAREPLVGVGTPSTRTLVWGFAWVVAAAAMLSFMFELPPSRWLFGGRSIDSKLADLADAVGNERTIEARLTGGFAYGPLRAAVRSGGSSAVPDNWTLFAAAGRIREEADRDPSAANLHALGVAHLVLGQHDEAVRALEDAVAEAPQNGRYHSDLAGAYLARARQNDRPDDVPRALGAAERALKADDALLEARFNRALALEALFLEGQARQAWEDYLAHDSSSGWASEGRARLEKLQQAMPPPDLARNNSPPPITDTSVEAGLDWLLREGLPRWAAAALSEDANRAAAEHLTLANYAQHISDASGDPFAADLVALTASGNATGVAVRLQAFGRGLVKWDRDDLPGMETELRAACTSPPTVLSSLCEIELGNIDVVRRDHARAQQRSVAAAAAGERAGHAYIRGRAARLDGYRVMFQGDYPDAVVHYTAALSQFEAAKYQRQVANLATQIGELHELLGFPRDAWRWRARGLAESARAASPSQLYLARSATAFFLARQGELAAARAFSRIAEEPGIPGFGSLQRAIALLEQSKVAIAEGDIATARDSLSAVDSTIVKSLDFRAQRLRPTVAVAEAAVLEREGNLGEAHEVISNAVAAFGPERGLYKASALLQRARLRTALADHAAAENDVQEALSLLATRSAIPQPVELDDADGAFQAIAALVLARPEFRTSAGVFLVERLRQILDGVPEPARMTTRGAVDRALRADATTATIEFLFADGSLLTWIADASGVRFVQRPVARAQIKRLTTLLQLQVAHGAAAEKNWRATLSELYDLLLRDLPGIESAANIVVVTDGSLQRVPFGALLDRGNAKFVFERAAVRVNSNLAFAIAGERATPASAQKASVLSIGAPAVSDADARGFAPLAGARDEAYKVAALYPISSVLVGHEATKERVLAGLPSANVVHFAGHAVAASSGGRSRLLLAGPAIEPRYALADTDLVGRVTQARVVLAACETASDTAHRTSGAATIAAAFLRSGAQSVIGTLWKVDDLASEPFFVNVHRALVNGKSASEAVAMAQRACYASVACRGAPATWIGTAAYGLE